MRRRLDLHTAFLASPEAVHVINATPATRLHTADQTSMPATKLNSVDLKDIPITKLHQDY